MLLQNMQGTEHRDDAPRFRVVKLHSRYVAEAVKIHLNSFTGFFLTSLGPAFLLEFYRSFLEDPVGVGFVALAEDDEVLGVIVGPTDPRGYFGRLVKRRWWAFAIAGTQAALRSPKCVPRLFHALRYRGEPPSGPARALLSSIAVSPRIQGRSIGAALVSAWLGEVRKRGATGCYLTTDGDGNEAVNRFYQRLGWTIEGQYETSEGRRMNRYVYDF